MATFYFDQSDTAPSMIDTLYDGNGAVVNLTGATITFTMTDRFGTVVINGAAAAIVGAGTNGTVQYDWQSTDLAKPSWYRGRWTVTFSGGKVESFPNADGIYTLLIIVTPR